MLKKILVCLMLTLSVHAVTPEDKQKAIDKEIVVDALKAILGSEKTLDELSQPASSLFHNMDRADKIAALEETLGDVGMIDPYEVDWEFRDVLGNLADRNVNFRPGLYGFYKGTIINCGDKEQILEWAGNIYPGFYDEMKGMRSGSSCDWSRQ